MRAVGAKQQPLADEVLVLAPPYEAFVPLRSVESAGRLPLGVIVVASGAEPIVALVDLIQVSLRCPWAAPCLALPPKIADATSVQRVLELVSTLHGRAAIVPDWHRLADAERIAHILMTLRAREDPRPHSLARWVTARISRPDLELLLHSVFRQALEPTATTDATRSPATYSRLFSRAGPYTARDWRSIARLAIHVHRGFRERPDISARTLTRHARKYLNVSIGSMIARAGWEWSMGGCAQNGRVRTEFVSIAPMVAALLAARLQEAELPLTRIIPPTTCCDRHRWAGGSPASTRIP